MEILTEKLKELKQKLINEKLTKLGLDSNTHVVTYCVDKNKPEQVYYNDGTKIGKVLLEFTHKIEDKDGLIFITIECN